MLSFNLQYTSPIQLDEARKKLQNTTFDKLLIQVFCGNPTKIFISQLLKELTTYFPKASIVGTTTAGEILNGESLENTTILSFTEFNHTTLHTSLLKQNDDLYRGGLELAASLNNPNVQLAILFGNGIKAGGAINGEPLLRGFQEGCSKATIVGGQAGDNGLAQETFVFTEKGYTTQGAAGVSLSGDKLKIDNRYNLSWVPLGKKMCITEAAKTQIKTIDGRPASEIYAHYLGDNVAERLPHSAAEFPLVVERNGVLLARHANKVQEDGSLDFMAPFYTGEKVQFAFCHSGLVAESAKKIYTEFSKYNHEAIFIYSCLSRKWVLGQDSTLELAPLAALAPTAGFFSYGEYFSNEGQNMFLSQTMTILAISEDSEDQKEISPKTPYDFKDNETKQNQDLQALHRLIETSAEEREELIKKLKRALAEIKTLQGFIPICASCKKIRDDQGYWNGIEQYISEHTEAQFSHGICPKCAETLYPEFFEPGSLQEEYKNKMNKKN